MNVVNVKMNAYRVWGGININNLSLLTAKASVRNAYDSPLQIYSKGLSVFLAGFHRRHDGSGISWTIGCTLD